MVELMIVAFLIGVTGVALYLSLAYGGKIGIRSRHQIKTSQILAKEMEIIRSESYTGLSVPYDGAFLKFPDPVSELPSGSHNLKIEYFDSPTNEIKKVTATVGWSEQGTLKNIQYTTLITEAGLNPAP